MATGSFTIVAIGIFTLFAVTSACGPDAFPCLNGKCIPTSWTCDGADDCGDGSDETQNLCPNYTCSKDEFQCLNGKCIPTRWTCDKEDDCGDGSDEAQKFCSKITCGPSMFVCNDGKCISLSWVCDGSVDCSGTGKEDEKNCSVACKEDEFACDSGQCIKQKWKCDADKDCKDGSDETNCEPRTCGAKMFRCLDGVCIQRTWFCDGDIDCHDKSDETNCKSVCDSDKIMCSDGRYCVSKSVLCDGTENCQDGSDELNCTALGGNPCSENNGGCEQTCVILSGNKHKCDCNRGFTLMNDSTTVCTDIDECKDNLIHGTCSQICKNTNGSHKCECVHNYSLVNKRYCKANGRHPELLLANRRDLRRINLETSALSLLPGDKYVKSAVALDFDLLGNKFYWTDVAKEAIFRADFDNTSSVEEVASTDVSTPDGLAVDWINKHLYWTDTGFDRIEISSLDGKMRKTLIKRGLDEPRAIVVDPNHGLMYWTDWGKQPKIERCGMDGNDRKVIINTTIAWPNGLTIDYVANRLYWVDSKLHTLESSNMLGLERVSVLQSLLHLRNPFAITVFEDFLYWTDWHSESIKKYSKFGSRSGEEVETIVRNLQSPMGLRVYHSNRQQILRRLCGDNKGGCSHFCLPKAYDVSNTEFYVCDCPNGFVLSSDRKTCVEGDITTGTTPSKASPSPVPVKPDSPNSSHNRSSSHVPTVTTPKPVVSTGSEVTKRPSGRPATPEVSTGSEVTEGPGYAIVTHPDQLNSTELHTPEHKAEENIGHIAGIVISVLCVLFIILGIVGYVLYRRYSRGNGKSMNFDNPVYRKTTTADDVTIENKLPPSMQPLTQNSGDVIC